MYEYFYNVKYALSSKGKIPIVHAKVTTNDDRYIYHQGRLLKIGRDIFRKREDALHAADLNRTAKIASLQAQIKKLETMTFTVDV
jgi:hypothetical protein